MSASLPFLPAEFWKSTTMRFGEVSVLYEFGTLGSKKEKVSKINCPVLTRFDSESFGV